MSRVYLEYSWGSISRCKCSWQRDLIYVTNNKIKEDIIMKKLKPVHDKIIVKPLQKDDTDEVTESGIILPDIVNQGTLVDGEIIGISEGMYSANGELIPSLFKVGDIVLYSKHNNSQEYNLNGENLLIMSQNEVLSLLEEEE